MLQSCFWNFKDATFLPSKFQDFARSWRPFWMRPSYVLSWFGSSRFCPSSVCPYHLPDYSSARETIVKNMGKIYNMNNKTKQNRVHNFLGYVMYQMRQRQCVIEVPAHGLNAFSWKKYRYFDWKIHKTFFQHPADNKWASVPVMIGCQAGDRPLP